MVRKLIKYDFRSYFRLLLPVQLILIGIALINRIVQIFEPAEKMSMLGDSTYNSIFVSSLVLYFISIAVCLIMTVIVAIVRFYQGMYTNEGYLSHTLPVTPTQHIIAKLLVSFLFILGSSLAVDISVLVITFGDLQVELFKAGAYLLGDLYNQLGANLIFYAIEIVAYALISVFTTLLMFYFCVSIGQLAAKKKVLAAFGVFFGLYVLSQIIGTVFVVFCTLNPEMIESVFEWCGEHVLEAIHIFLCGEIVYDLIIGAVYFLITKYIMSKKLNLT